MGAPRLQRARLAAFLAGALDPDEAAELRGRAEGSPRLAARLDELALELVWAEPRVSAIVEAPGRYRLSLQPDFLPTEGCLASYEATLCSSEIYGPDLLAYVRQGRVEVREPGDWRFSTRHATDLWDEAMALLAADQQAQETLRHAQERFAPLHWRLTPPALPE